VELEVLDAHGPRAARVAVQDVRGKTVGGLPGLGWIWVDGSFRAALPEGGFNIFLSSGPRVATWRGALKVETDAPVCRHQVLGAFPPRTHPDWWLCDPFVQADAGQENEECYSFSRLSEVALAARGEGVELVGLAGGWNLRTREGSYRSLPDGASRLMRGLAKTRDERFLGVFAWSWERLGHGRVYALEPRPAPAATRPATASCLYETVTRIHDRGGVAVAAHPLGALLDETHPGAAGVARELLFAFLAGRGVDAIDVSRRGDDLRFWWMLLNEGYCVTALGGGPDMGPTAKIDVPATGCYVQMEPDAPEPSGVLAAVREGRIVVSNGPFVSLKVDGLGTGATVSPSDGLRTIYVEALSSADRADSIKRVDLIYNGECLRTLSGCRAQRTLRTQVRDTLPEAGWVAARYYSTKDALWAMSNPVYVRAAGQTPPRAATAHITAHLADAQSGRALHGTLEVWNLGARIQEIPLQGQPVTLDLPPTVRLRFQAPGYAPQTRSLWRDGPPGRILKDLTDPQQLRKAMLSWKTFQRLRASLGRVGFQVDLEKAGTAPGQAEATPATGSLPSG